jgi:hypothetical protein
LSPINISSANPPIRPPVQALSLAPTRSRPANRSIFNPGQSSGSFFDPQNLNPNLTTMNVLQQQNPLSPISRRAIGRHSDFLRSRPREPRP